MKLLKLTGFARGWVDDDILTAPDLKERVLRYVQSQRSEKLTNMYPDSENNLEFFFAVEGSNGYITVEFTDLKKIEL